MLLTLSVSCPRAGDALATMYIQLTISPQRNNSLEQSLKFQATLQHYGVLGLPIAPSTEFDLFILR